MKKLFLTSIIFLSFQGLLPALSQDSDNFDSSTPVTDKWALLVGISKFDRPSLNLKYAAKDAGDFKDFLINKCHFAADHILSLENERATRDNIMESLGDTWLPRVAIESDLVVIYFSSHGSPSDMDVAGINYLVAHDTNPDKLFTTGISIQNLAETIKQRVRAKRVLIILDACHSGGASASKGLIRTANVDAAQIAQGTGHAVICSSAKSESSWESKNYKNGVFTHTLIESFQTNGSDTKLSEAFNKLKTGVQSQVAAERGVSQTPVLEASKWKGDELVLAINPASPRPVPQEVLNSLKALESEPISLENGSNNNSTNKATISRSPNAIPDISGDFLGSNGLKYTYWQKERKCGWNMPQFGVKGDCNISPDGKTLYSSWTGFISGKSTASLECDENGKVIKIIADDGTVLDRLNR
ncbi:MAG: caspase family protein [Cyanobacteria bacterium TGS_CYA1]|nr:caspase family protein [Cyanobacteria bacterium TGS_CYA1]